MVAEVDTGLLVAYPGIPVSLVSWGLTCSFIDETIIDLCGVFTFCFETSEITAHSSTAENVENVAENVHSLCL